MAAEKPGLIRPRRALELDRLRDELAAEFPYLPAAVVDAELRAAIDRWGASPVQDYVAIFVARSARDVLRRRAG